MGIIPIDLFNLQSTLDTLEVLTSLTLSDTPSFQEIQAHRQTLSSIKTFIETHADEIFINGMNPSAFSARAIEIQGRLEQLGASSSHSLFEANAYRTPTNNEEDQLQFALRQSLANEPAPLISQQNLEYLQAKAADQKRKIIDAFCEEKSARLHHIQTTPLSQEKFHAIARLFEETKDAIKHQSISKESAFPLLNALLEEYRGSLACLKEQAERQSPAYLKSEQIGSMILLIELKKLDGVDQAFENLSPETKQELAEGLGFPRPILLTFLREKKPFTQWSDVQAAAAVLEIIKPACAFEHYDLFTENENIFIKQLDAMERWIADGRTSPPTTSTSPSSSSQVPPPPQASEALHQLLNALERGDPPAIDIAFAQLPASEQKELAHELRFPPTMFLGKPTPFTQWEIRTAKYHRESAIAAVQKLTGNQEEISFEEDSAEPLHFSGSDIEEGYIPGFESD